MHCCASDVPIDLLVRSGAQGLSVDLDQLSAEGYDGVAGAFEAGHWLFLGVVPTTSSTIAAKQVIERVERFLEMVGLDPSDRLVLTPACGLAGADPVWARGALSRVAEAAKSLDN